MQRYNLQHQFEPNNKMQSFVSSRNYQTADVKFNYMYFVSDLALTELHTLTLGPLGYKAPHKVGTEITPMQSYKVMGLEHMGLLKVCYIHF